MFAQMSLLSEIYNRDESLIRKAIYKPEGLLEQIYNTYKNSIDKLNVSDEEKTELTNDVALKMINIFDDTIEDTKNRSHLYEIATGINSLMLNIELKNDKDILQKVDRRTRIYLVSDIYNQEMTDEEIINQINNLLSTYNLYREDNNKYLKEEAEKIKQKRSK